MSTGKITFVLGGARSGKSSFAQALAEGSAGPLVYIATAEAFDAEMTERIARHKSDRGPRWQTVECPIQLGATLVAHQGEGSTILIDCLTLWLSNLILGDHDVSDAVSRLLASLKTGDGPVIMVSNEVGQGIVPDNALARRFRDEAGRLHQAIAAVADDVWFVTAGIPQRLKGAQ